MPVCPFSRHSFWRTAGWDVPRQATPATLDMLPGARIIADAKASAAPPAARPGGQVVAPAPGRVSFAGDYRGYGKIVIIDHGGGWTSLVTGMIALSVGVGDTLDAGTPVGRAGSQDSRITIELRRAGRPVDIVAMLG